MYMYNEKQRERARRKNPFCISMWRFGIGLEIGMMREMAIGGWQLKIERSQLERGKFNQRLGVGSWELGLEA